MRCTIPPRTSVDFHILNAADPFDQHPAQLIHSFHIPVKLSIHQLCRPGKPCNSRHIFSTRTHSLLLPASIYDRIHSDAVFYIQKSDTFRAMYLMSADRQQIHIHSGRIDPELAESLHGVHMEQCLRVTALDQRTGFRHRLYTSDLVIYMHDRYQDRVLPHRPLQFLQGDPPLTVHREISHLKSLSLQIRHGLQNSRMLHPCRDQMPSSSVMSHRRTDQRNIIRLRTAGSKQNLFLIHFHQSGQRFSGIP